MLTGMCERECANRDEFLTRGLQCSAQGFAGASGNVRAGMVFDAGFAVFCAGFRRGERGWFLTRGLQWRAVVWQVGLFE